MTASGAADLVVVGGGPAGLATAIAARLRGLEVVLLERATPPIDKPCGEGLMPRGVGLLERLGVTEPARLGRPFAGIRFVDGEHSAEGRFRCGPGLGIRRTRLHAALVARAGHVGVDARWGVRVTGLTSAGVATTAGEVPGRFVVAADGLASRVRGWAGLPEGRVGRRRFGMRRHFRVASWSSLVEVHWGAGCEAFVTPVGEEEVGVALLRDGDRGRFDDLLARLPALAARLEGAAALSPVRGAGPFDRRVRRRVRGRVALVGDAAGYVDPITGEGVSVALGEAVALADALAAGNLAAYERAVRRLRGASDLLTRLVVLLGPRPRLRRRVILALGRRPERFSRLLATHGERGPAGARLGIALLRLGLGLAATSAR